jgi:endoglucanase
MGERMRRCVLLIFCGLIVGVGATSAAPASPEAGKRGLHVVGNRLVDAKGRTVHLRGVNRAGTEYACVQGWGFFDGPNSAASVRAMAAWRMNAIRIPLNETCWLAINGVKAQYSGANYRRAIVNYVKLLHRHNMYAELSLMWAAPGSYRATYQPSAPDKDHSPAFWSSLAKTFKNDPNVVLAPWGETTVDADCFLNGGVCSATYGPNNQRYATAGMQQAVTVMRRAGYRGPIVIPGIDYANNLSEWLSHKPKDPLRQLMAEAHVYGKNTCSSTSCLNRTMLPVARRVPLIFGETGPSYDDSDCGSGTISRLLRWADTHNVGYEAWTWNTWRTCNSIINDFVGAPRGEYGSWLKSYYALRAKTTHGPRR